MVTALIAIEVGDTPHIVPVQVWEKPEEADASWQVPVLEVEDAIRNACKRWQVNRGSRAVRGDHQERTSHGGLRSNAAAYRDNFSVNHSGRSTHQCHPVRSVAVQDRDRSER